MHDSTRRLVVVTLFFVLGPLVTLVLATGLFLRSLPVAARWEERWVESQTPWAVSIGSVERPLPNVVRYKDFAILHSKTRVPMVVCPELELKRKGSVWLCEAVEMVVQLNEMGSLDMFREFNRMVFDLFEEGYGDGGVEFVLSVESVEIVPPGVAERELGGSVDLAVVPESRFRLTFLEGKFVSGRDGKKLRCSFNMSDSPTAAPIVLEMERGGREGALLHLVYATDPEDSAGVPTYSSGRFLMLLFPDLMSSGQDCWFSGRIEAVFLPDQTLRVQLVKTDIQGIDLARLAPMLTDYRVSGLFRLGIREAMLEFSQSGTRLQYADGWGEIRRGTLQKELLAKLIDQFALGWVPGGLSMNGGSSPLDYVRPGSDIPLNHSVIGFDLNESGCLFSSVDESGMIMKFEGNHNLYLPESRAGARIPYASVLYSLMPDSAELVPLTPQSQKIIPLLPLGAEGNRFE